MPVDAGPPPAITFESFQHPVTALVQGASRGIGLALVHLLLRTPAVDTVIATCREPDGAGDLSAAAGTGRTDLRILRLDVTDEASIEHAAGEAAHLTDRLDLILNVSGLLHDGAPGMQPEKRLADLSPGPMRRAFEVNAIGPALVVKHFHRLLPKRSRAIVASLSARVGSIGDNRRGGWYSYRSSKAAQNMITRTAAIELARIRPGCICVALHPGTVRTGLSRPFRSRVPASQTVTSDHAADRIVKVLDGLGPEDNGGFFGWDGRRIPW